MPIYVVVVASEVVESYSIEADTAEEAEEIFSSGQMDISALSNQDAETVFGTEKVVEVYAKEGP